MYPKIFPVLVLAFAGNNCSALADNWPTFRGPKGDGISPATQLPLEWNENKNVTWKVEIGGRGWSTPVIWGEQIWLTTATEDGKEMSAICLDRKTGRELFRKVVFTNDKVEPLGNPVNGYSSPTGCVEEGRAYLNFGSYGTIAIDTASFEKLWERRDLPCRHYRGPGSSLVLWKNTLILTMDGVDTQYVAALDNGDGRTVWKTERSTAWNDLDENGKPKADGDYRKAYATPIFARVGGQDQLISVSASSAFGYDPNTGKEIWKIAHPGFSNASTPVFGNGIAYMNTGYGKPNLWALPIEGKTGEIPSSDLLWEETKRVPLRSSPLLHDGILYMVSDDGNASARDARTGDIFWEERLEGNFSGSPICADGRLYFCNEQKETFVLATGKTYRLLARNALASGLMASPAAVDHELYLRTKSHLYRIEGK